MDPIWSTSWADLIKPWCQLGFKNQYTEAMAIAFVEILYTRRLHSGSLSKVTFPPSRYVFSGVPVEGAEPSQTRDVLLEFRNALTATVAPPELKARVCNAIQAFQEPSCGLHAALSSVAQPLTIPTFSKDFKLERSGNRHQTHAENVNEHSLDRTCTIRLGGKVCEA